MEDEQQGCSQQRPDCIPEVGEDVASGVSPSASVPMLTDEEQEELRGELLKVEDEIQTLSQVLAAKEKQMADIKRKLGITPLDELKQNFTKSWQEVTTSTAYKKTSEGFNQVGQKATAAFSSMGTAISRKLEDVRNTPSFKSFEEKVETLKIKMNPPGVQGEQLDSNPDEPMLSQPEATPLQEAPTH